MEHNTGEKEIKDTPRASKNLGKEDFLSLFKNPVSTPHVTKTVRKKTPKRRFEDEKEDKELNRPRTPSGQVLTASVGDIKQVLFKNLFEDHGKIHIKQPKALKLDIVKENCNAESEKTTIACSTVTNINTHGCHDQLSENPFDAVIELSKKKREKVIMSEVHGEEIAASGDINSDGTGAVLNTSQETEMEGLLMDNPTIDIRTVMKMIGEMKSEIATNMTAQIQQLRVELAKSQHQETHQCAATQEVPMLRAKIEVCEAKERMMVDTMHLMSQRISELQIRMDNSDLNSAKRMLILSGFELSEKRQDRNKQIERFLYSKMGVDILLEDSYQIGSATPRETVITLLSINDKYLIFQNVSKIKNLKNSHGKKYYFREYMPARQNDFRKKSQHIADQVAKLDEHEQEEVSIYKGDIYVGDRKYQKIVTEPDATQVLNMPLHELNQIMAMEINRGANPVYKDGNKFTGYSLCTNDPKTIAKAYMKIRLNHAEARHIICAWNIPGLRKYESADGCDDQDNGASIPIVQLLTDNQIESRVIFVVRNCGKKLNAERNSCYVQVAKALISEFPLNPVTNTRQQILDQVKSTYANVVKSPPQTEPKTNQSAANRGGRRRGQVSRGRGRGVRGRGRGGRGRGRGTGHKYVTENESPMQFQFSAPTEAGDETVD